MKISIFNRQTSLPVKLSSLRNLVTFILKTKKISCQEIAIYLVGKRKISLLHKQFFNDPFVTDCITFPIDSDYLGEIFICPQVAYDYNPKKPYVETSLYIIHAILHLLGYDDLEESQRKIMHKEQMRLLKLAIKHRCILQTSS